MSDQLTDEQLAAIRERADAATPGPWKVTWDGENDPDGAWSAEWPWLIRQDIYPGKSVANLAEVEASTEDAEFIAASREDIPALLAHIDTLTTERNALVDVIMRHTDICVFGGGHVRNGVARRDSCKYGHPGCACADWIATRGLDDEASS